MPYLIIGIDPGHTVGVAALDLSGRLVHVSHLPAGGLSGAVSLIEKWGTPSLIATDVRPAPEMALKLASSFNVPLFVPARPWREEDKKAALKNLIQHLPNAPSSPVASNTHERDAISAAIQAWRAEQNLLREADMIDLPHVQKERFKHLLLQGYRTDFALKKIAEENAPAPIEAPAPRPSAPSSTLSPLHSQHLSALERQNIELRKRISMMEHETEGLLHRLRLLENGVRERIVRENLYRQMAADIHRLKEVIDSMRRPQNSRRAGRPNKIQSNPTPKSSPQAHSPSKPSHSASNPFHPSASSASAETSSLKVLDPYERLAQMLSAYRRNRSGPDDRSDN